MLLHRVDSKVWLVAEDGQTQPSWDSKTDALVLVGLCLEKSYTKMYTVQINKLLYGTELKQTVICTEQPIKYLKIYDK